jgi:AT-binding transcription factor 1
MSAVSTYSEDSNSSISYSERNITSPVFNQSTLSWKRKSSTEDNRDPSSAEEPRAKLPKTTNLFPPMVPPPTVPTAGNPTDLEASMRKFYEDTMKRYMEEIQGRPPTKDGQALDLRSSSADLDHGSHRSENDNDSEENWDKSAASGGEDSSMDHQRMSSSDFDAEPSSDPTHPNGGSVAAPVTPNNHPEVNGGAPGKEASGSKRFRTHMSNVQVKMMKNIFENYKTPTMPECLGLGNDIGLQKRVVQVWFQVCTAILPDQISLAFFSSSSSIVMSGRDD